jgi:4-amino-4-deoxy-L-arabinose transferase-like glycosyltransferase
MWGLKRYRYATWALIAIWFLFNGLTLGYNGPFFDEGIYLTAGQRVWERHGYSDGYLRWFAGSLLWPTLVGGEVRAGGLEGARAIALSLSAVTLLALCGITRNLFGDRAALWATLAFALSGPFMALARMAVYDALALAGIATSLWAITQLAKRGNRAWLVVAAAAYTVGMFAKYPAALMLFPLMGVLVVLRRGQAITDVALFGFLSLALALAFYLPVRDDVAYFIRYRLTHSPSSRASIGMIAVELSRLSALPLLLAISGWLVARRARAVATVLLLSLLLWPAYHLVLKDSVSSTKHLAYGFLFAYPLAGLAIGTVLEANRPWALTRRAAVAGLMIVVAVAGIVQRDRLGHAWPDARPAAAYLVDRVQPGEKLLINESWPYTMYLYRAGRIESPWDVFDVYRITHGESEITLCQYDWFVDSQWAYAWPDAIANAVHRCGTFEQVYVAGSTVVNMGTDLNYIRYPVSVQVWHNVAGR